jgi:hypothetical protein
MSKDLCQADPMALGSDGIAPEGALQFDDSAEALRKITGALNSAKAAHPEIQYAGFMPSIAKRVCGALFKAARSQSQIEEPQRGDTVTAEQPGDIFWATWNDCNGVFDVYRTRNMAREAVGGLEDEFMSVVPVWVKVAPEKDHFYCHWHEDDRDQWRSGPRADGPEIIGSVRSSQIEEPHRGDTDSAEQREAGPAPIPASKAYCAFCGQGDAEFGIDKLVEGPTVCICEFCVKNAVLVLDSRKASVNA